MTADELNKGSGGREAVNRGIKSREGAGERASERGMAEEARAR